MGHMGVFPEDKDVGPKVTLEEADQLETIRAWVKAHSDDVFSEALLDEASIRRYLAPPAHTRFDDHTIPM